MASAFASSEERIDLHMPARLRWDAALGCYVEEQSAADFAEARRFNVYEVTEEESDE